MVSRESPTVARRRVRLALREARQGKGLTQRQVAEALEWSLSKVNRIESGEVGVSTTDLRALLEFYGIDDEATIDALVEDSRTSRRQRWYTDPRYREHLTPGMLQLLEYESEANAIRAFNNAMVPGLLQTPEYATSVFEALTAGDLPEDDAPVRLEVRSQRYDQVFRGSDPPEYFLILDESVLFREVGGPKVMGDQLRAVLHAAESPNIRVRVGPFAAAAPIALLGPFMILDLGSEDDAVLYREGYLMDEVIQSPQRIHRFRDVFERLWALSLDEDASAAVIEARASAMLAAHYRAVF
jgi:transcriptional regulator with XRE-family HTH domain